MSNVYVERTKAVVAMNKAKGEASKLDQENIKLKELLKDIRDVCDYSLKSSMDLELASKHLAWISLQIKLTL